MYRWLWPFLLTLSPIQAVAQDTGGEIIVTAARREAEGYDERVPAVGLRKTADFAVQFVQVTGDTRDSVKRHDEIYAMVAGAIALAAKRGSIELATGEMVVEPLTVRNYRDLKLSSAGRPDTDKAHFIIKTRLGGGVDAKAALERIQAFIKAVPAVGRAEMTADDDLTLSVVGPDQYRGQIADLVAADAKTYAAKLGPNYGVEIRGLDRPVEWTRASLTEVLLYVPYSYVVTPERP